METDLDGVCENKLLSNKTKAAAGQLAPCSLATEPSPRGGSRGRLPIQAPASREDRARRWDRRPTPAPPPGPFGTAEKRLVAGRAGRTPGAERGPWAPGTALEGPGVSARNGGVPAHPPSFEDPPAVLAKGTAPRPGRHPGKTKGRSRVPSTGSGPTATAPPPLPSPRLPAVRTGPAWSRPPWVLGVRGSDVWGAGRPRLPPCPSSRPSPPGHKHPFRTHCVLGCLSVGAGDTDTRLLPSRGHMWS